MPFTPEFLSALERLRERVRRVSGHARPAYLAVLLVAHAAWIVLLTLSLVLPAVAKGYLIREVSAALGRPIGIESLRFNPLTCGLSAKGLTILEKDGHDRFAGFAGLEVDFEPTDLMGRRISVKRFTLVSPSFRLARGKDGALNIADLIPVQDQEPGKGSFSLEFSPEGLNFSLSDVRMIGGSVVFDDAMAGARHEVKDLHFSMESFRGDRPGLREIFISGAQVNESSVSLRVRADLSGDFPHAEARLHVKDVVFGRYTPYLLPFKRPLDLTVDEAGLAAAVVLPGKGAGNAPPKISGSLKITGMSLSNGEERVAGAGSLEVQEASVDLSGPRLEIGRVAVDSPMLKLTRDETGALDLLTLFERAGESAAHARDAQESGAGAPAVRIGEVAVKNGGVTFTDHDLDVAAALKDIRARLTELDTGEGRFASFELEASGDRFKHVTLSARGGYAPLKLTGKASLDAMDLSKSLPALARLLPRLSLAGIAGLKADFALSEHDGEIKPEVRASLDVHGLRVAAQGHEQPVLEASAFSLSGIQVRPDARLVSVAQLSLSGGRALAAFDTSGRLTALDLLTPGSGQPKTRRPQADKPEREHGRAAGPPHKEDAPPHPSRVKDHGAKPESAHPPKSDDHDLGKAVASSTKPQAGHGPDWDQPAQHEGVPPAKAPGAQVGHAEAAKTAPHPGGPAHTAAGQAVREGTPHAAGGHPPAALPAARAKAAPRREAHGPWEAEVGQARLSSFSLDYHDAKSATRLGVDIEELAVKGFSSDLDKPLSLSAKGLIGRKAAFEVLGEYAPKRRAATLKLKLADLDLPEIAALAGPLPAVIRSGTLHLSGEIAASLPPEGIKASFAGDAGIKALALSGPHSPEPWLSLAGLTLSEAFFTLSPLEFRAASLTLDQPAASLTLDKDGMPVLPFETKPSGHAGGKNGGKESLLNYRVDSVVIRDGRVDITAEGFDTPQKMTVGAIAAKATGVRPGEPARLSIGLAAGHTGVFKAEGTAGWAGKSPVLDLKASLSNLDLGEFSAVSLKFTGFPITRGKLGLELDYKATQKMLDLKNKIVVTGIQLGPKAPPKPGRKDVPLDLAVSLLADGKGVIDLDIPVKGAVGQAKADLGDVISTAMGGAFGKILTSPFAFLKVAQGSGETMPVVFAPGSAELGAEAKKSLATLGEALAKRPRLSLEVLAFADPDTESAAYAAVLAERYAAKHKAAPSAEAAKAPERKGLFKPRQSAQAPPPEAKPEPAAPPPGPTQADWERLARERQDAVLAFLAGEAKLPQERVFPVAADPVRPPKRKDQPGHRAEIKLRF